MRLSRPSAVIYGSYNNPGRTSLSVDQKGRLVVQGHTLYDNGRPGAEYRIEMEADPEDWGALLNIVRAGYESALGNSKPLEEFEEATRHHITEDGHAWSALSTNSASGAVARVELRSDDRLLVATDLGNGALVAAKMLSSSNPALLLDLRDSEKVVTAVVVRPNHDHVAVVSQNGKFLVFPVSELPLFGSVKRGVRLQKYKMARGRLGDLEIDGGLADVASFEAVKGLSWTVAGGKTRTEVDFSYWLGVRGSVGKRPPHGFPKCYKFR